MTLYSLQEGRVEPVSQGAGAALPKAADVQIDKFDPSREEEKITETRLAVQPSSCAAPGLPTLWPVSTLRDQGLPLAVRGGGHNVAGSAVCDDGLVVDLSEMKGIKIDCERRTANAEPGLLWGEFDGQTQAVGLATPGGIVTHTGIAGLTLGGGIGWLARRHGLTCDQLSAATVVTADGSVLRTGERENVDLLWGLRGGGGNFGIVTSFEYRRHALGPQVLAGLILHPAERAREVLRFYRDYLQDIPDDLTTIVNLRYAPPAPFLPPDLHGRAVVVIAVCYAGPVEKGQAVLAPLRTFGEPLIDLIRPAPYLAHQSMFDASVPHGLRYYWKSHYLKPLSDEAIDILVTHAWQAPSATSYTIIFHLGGAKLDVADEFAKLPDTSILPAGSIKSSGIVPLLGEHWVNPKDHPPGPIYCVHKGKVVCIEYMMSQADLQAGKSWPELVGLKNLPPIDYVDMGFVSKGHPGYEIPHYDLPIYFVSRDALKTITPTQ